jgi:hypothetical protein
MGDPVSGGWIAVLIVAIALIRSREANLAAPLDMPATAADLHPPAPGRGLARRSSTPTAGRGQRDEGRSRLTRP